MLLLVVAAKREVAAKKMGGNQGCRQHLCIAQATLWVGGLYPGRVGEREQIIKKAVHCDGLFAHGLDVRGSQRPQT